MDSVEDHHPAGSETLLIDNPQSSAMPRFSRHIPQAFAPCSCRWDRHLNVGLPSGPGTAPRSTCGREPARPSAPSGWAEAARNVWGSSRVSRRPPAHPRLLRARVDPGSGCPGLYDGA